MIRIIIVFLAVAIQACSVVQATSGPERKDLGAFAYGVLAVATLGISEVVTSPIECVAGKGAEMKIKVTYTANKEVLEVVVLGDDRAFKGDELESADQPKT